MYETLPLGDVDSRVGQFAKHDKDKASAKPLDGAEQEDSEVGASYTLLIALPSHAIQALPDA